MDKLLNIAICDDNEIFLCDLEKKITCYFIKVNISAKIKSFSSGTELINNLTLIQFDLIFLDINMPEHSGFEIAKIIKQYNSKIEIVFVSNEDHLVFNAFEFKPFRFIRKSKHELELIKTLEDYYKLLSLRDAKLKIKVNTIEIDLSVSKIKYIESKLRNKELHLDNEVFVIRTSMNNLLILLNDFGFVKIHNSFIVNYRLIHKMSRTEITLIDGTTLPISKHIFKEATDKIAKLKMGELL